MGALQLAKTLRSARLVLSQMASTLQVNLPSLSSPASHMQFCPTWKKIGKVVVQGICSRPAQPSTKLLSKKTAGSVGLRWECSCRSSNSVSAHMRWLAQSCVPGDCSPCKRPVLQGTCTFLYELNIITPVRAHAGCFTK